MVRQLTKKDYKKLLKFYGKHLQYDTNKTRKKKYSSKKTQQLLHKILAKKMCRCVKSVQKNPRRRLKEPQAIAVCNDSIFKKKGINFHRFTCKNGYKLHPKKGTNSFLTKK